MAEDGPVTRREIEGLRQDLLALLREELGGMEQRLREEIRANEVKLTKRMDDFAAALQEQIRESQEETLKAVLAIKRQFDPFQGWHA
ncbi:MAG: hypothetical protein ABSH32_35770 [Bryobacteraceae bacterium]|jgi:hypothetical protein